MENITTVITDSLPYKFVTGKRMKSLYWTTFAQFIAACGDILIQTLTEWNPEAYQTVFAGLIVAQITKYLNTSK